METTARAVERLTEPHTEMTDAWVFDNAQIGDNSWVSDNARISGNAQVFNNT